MPAADDCSTGTLLSGEVGKLFDRMLAAIGRDRNSIYLASLSCLRSPDGRFTSDSATQCVTLARHHVGSQRRARCCCSGDAAPRRCSASAWRRRAVAGTKSRHMPARLGRS
jgi:DNA polymerase